MGRSVQPLANLDAASLPSDATVSNSSGRLLRVYRDANGWHQSETELNVFVEDYPLEYAVGAGANGFTFLVKRGDFLFQAPLSFYTKNGKWDFSPGYESVDLGFSRTAPEACLVCHSGRTNPVPHHRGEYRNPVFTEQAVGCENCHGPGATHVLSAGRRRESIINPARLPARLAEDICMNCHQRGDARILQPGKSYADFRPGTALFETLAIFRVPSDPNVQSHDDLLEHDAAMKASRCFRASGGRLSCFTCHDPHVEPKGPQAVSFYRARCLSCHTDASCRLPLAARNAEKTADDCIACHMPKREVAAISHSALTNHRIPASPVAASAAASAAPSAAASAAPSAAADRKTGLLLIDAPYRGERGVPDLTLLRAYQELAPQNSAYQERYLQTLNRLRQTQPDEPIVAAALGHKALIEGQSDEALTYLTRALPLDEPAIYVDLAKACNNLGRGDEALTYLERGIKADPFDPFLQKTLILEYINQRRYPEARQAMEEYIKLFPGDSFMRSLLARVSN